MSRLSTALIIAALICAGATPRVAQRAVSFQTQDGWTIHADVYGTAADPAVVLIHGGRFTKESWQRHAPLLVKAGFRVLAIDLRGFGRSAEGPAALNTGFESPLDALAAVRYLRKAGAKHVSIVGASMGADAATGASIASAPGEIDRLVLLAGSADDPGEKLKGRKLFIVARDDANAAGPRLPKIRTQYERSAEPKELIVLDGSAHAQFLFDTGEGDRLMREMLRFLTAR